MYNTGQYNTQNYNGSSGLVEYVVTYVKEKVRGVMGYQGGRISLFSKVTRPLAVIGKNSIMSSIEKPVQISHQPDKAHLHIAHQMPLSAVLQVGLKKYSTEVPLKVVDVIQQNPKAKIVK